MVHYTPELYNAVAKLDRLKKRKIHDGTAIYYAEKHLDRLLANDGKIPRSKRSPGSPQIQKTTNAFNGKGSQESRAYVLSQEIHDLTQAIVALERLR